MKKLTLILFVALMFSCGGYRSLDTEDQKTKFKNNFLVSEGMTKQEVINLMGTPQASEFDKGVEEFHYCRTGIGSDKFVSFFFADGIVVSKTSYTVTEVDVGYTYGHCSKFVKRGTYRTPDRVVEIRASIN